MSEFKEYKVGEKIVYHSLPHQRLFYVKAVLDDSIVVRECWDEAGAKCFSEFLLMQIFATPPQKK
ncbi:hypothetical protein BANRA_02488 [Acinetobacter baumannii]|nr:hypothetical protein BANRA_02488 [Acinetobacter baumannii]